MVGTPLGVVLGILFYPIFRLKKFGGEEVYPNDIIARQRGFKWKTGENVVVGKDQTVHAACEGIVHFRPG